MHEQGLPQSKTLQPKSLTRRNLFRGAVGTVLGAGFLRPSLAYASDDGDEHENAACVGINPIPGGVKALSPYGVFVHHNPIRPVAHLTDISDPSQITDFDGFVGLTHILGGGTGTNTTTGATAAQAYQADMGFGQGNFIGTDGRLHRGTFAFV
jgi:hypothetical protein